MKARLVTDIRAPDAKPGDNEIEPYPATILIINRGALVDACLWLFDLPKVKK